MTHQSHRNQAPRWLMPAKVGLATAAASLLLANALNSQNQNKAEFRQQFAWQLDQYNPDTFLLPADSDVTTTPNNIVRTTDVDPDNHVDISDGKPLKLKGIYTSKFIPDKVAFSYVGDDKEANPYLPENIYWVDKDKLMTEKQAFGTQTPNAGMQPLVFQTEQQLGKGIEFVNKAIPQGAGVAEEFIGQ